MSHRTLRDIRVERGLSQKALAEQANVAQATISHLETGRYAASVSTLRRVAKVLGLTLDEVLALDPTPPEEADAPPDGGVEAAAAS